MKKFRQECLKENYPIMSEAVLKYICQILKDNDTILELGSCVGYSAIYIAKTVNVTITSIERDLQRHLLAKENVKLYSVENQVKMIYDDALSYEPTHKFDLIIFDAGKAQNEAFFNRYWPYLKPKGHIIIDNVDFHGYKENIEALGHRKNLKAMMKKLNEFEKSLNNNNELTFEYHSIGDGILDIIKL